MRTTIYFILILTLVISCQNKPTEEINDTDGLIQISKQQFESEQMKMGKIQQHAFPSKIYFTGYIRPKANGWAKVGLPVEGIIQKIEVNEGESVEKGAPLLVVGGNAVIDLQQQYAESNARLKQLKIDYDRVHQLYQESIASQKEYVMAQSQYDSEKAQNNALQIKLQNIGLDVKRVAEGNLYPGYIIKAPIKGHITSIHATLGEFTSQQQILMTIVDRDELQLQLTVFEKDVSSVKPGQSVEFNSGNSDEKAMATISFVGKTVREDSKSIDCYAAIERQYQNLFISNQFVDGEIILSSDTVNALPVTAIIQSDNDNYVLSLEKETNDSYLFRAVMLNTGRRTSDFIEVKDQLTSKEILINGVYNIIID